mmetsp:Transcript_25001/g.57952  ORF Transcript_25001/g.57952 Transcript_25001/m.57952 type:complete len:205 (+) Transcript_25001:83-697(+)
MAAARRRQAEEEERERVRSSIVSFLDSSNPNLQQSLDQTVAGIILSPRQADRTPQYIPDSSDPQRLAVRTAVRAFLEDKNLDVETVAHRIATSQLDPQLQMPPERPPWDDIEERVNSRLSALIDETHRDLVREKQRLQNEALMRETLDVTEHARQVSASVPFSKKNDPELTRDRVAPHKCGLLQLKAVLIMWERAGARDERSFQ